MQFDEFIGQVQNRASLGAREDAIKAVRATLQTLGERITPDQAKNVSSQLPEEVGEFLRNADTGPQRFDSSEFIHRVSEREGAQLTDATHHVRVVMEVLDEAVSVGESVKLAEMLPDDYGRLFAGSEGKMPPS